MAGSRTTFEKLQRDRAKKAKADAKRAKRMGKTPERGPLVYEEDVAPVVDDDAAQLDGNLDQEISAADLLRLVEELQAKFDEDEIDFEPQWGGHHATRPCKARASCPALAENLFLVLGVKKTRVQLCTDPWW